MIKKCLICGKKFKIRLSHFEKRKTCSFECAGTRRSMNQTSKRIEKVCQHCGKKFKIFPSKEKQKCCSDKCRSLSQRNRIIKICQYCGKEYTIRKYRENDSKFCNMECRNKWDKQFMIDNSGSFKKGNVTWSTGKKCPQLSGENHWNWKEGISKDKNHIHDLNRKYRKKIRQTLRGNLNHRISGLIRLSLKGNKNGWHWEKLVGYTLNNLIERLNETMPVGYTRKDFLSGELHIDHIIPISVFNFTRAEHTDFKRCWALENLRLLPARENLIKSNHLDRPFQPALKI